MDNQVLTVSNTTNHAASSYATTAALSANYANGTGGVGATLTNSIALAALTIDGYTFTATDVTNSTRVVIKDQPSALQNGIYTVTNQGSALVAWVLTRAADFNTVGTGPNYIQTGAASFVTSGSVNASTGWVMNTSGTITVGTTALTWAQTSSSSSVTVTSPLTKVGSVISLGTVTVPFGGTGLTTLTAYSVMIGNGTGNVAFATPSTTGYALLSTGASSNPSFGQLSLTAGVTGTLPVANGGTGTATAFTTGSVVFAGPSGVYAQDNAKFFWDDTNNRLGINTATPQVQLTILSNTQTVTPTATLPAGTDLYIVGANAANTRITQDAYGSGNYSAYTGRHARGTAASPTASQSGDFLTQLTGRGYGATGFAAASTGYFSIAAAENFTDTAQGTYASVYTTAIGANSPTEVFRFGTAGQFGIGAGTYGTSGYVLTSGGASAAPTWSQVSASSLTGILPVANGGTGLASWTTGSLVYASASTTLAGLADVATGNVLLSGGVGVAPAWGQVSLTTAVTGTLPIANGGTGLATTPANGALDIGNGTGFTRTTLTQGTNIAITNGVGSISIATSATPSFATSVTTPLVIGGTAASSSLTLQSTSGVGTSDSILFKVGNNGATTAMSIATGGTVTIGTLNLTNALGVGYGGTGLTTTPANGALDIGNGTGFTRTTLTAGTNIAITNGAGSISIATSATPSFATSVTTPLVIGGTAASSSLTLQSTSGVGTTDSILFKVGNNGATTAMTVDSSGNVEVFNGAAWVSTGIGPTGKQLTLGYDTTNSIGYIRSANNGTAYTPLYVDGSFVRFNTGSASLSEAMRIDASGNVGIGTTSPGKKLDVFNSGTTTTDLVVRNGTVSLLAFVDSGAGYIGTSTNHSLLLTTNNTTRVTIDTSGNVTTTAAISDSIGNVRTVPENTKTAAYVLLATDSGKYINITTGGITVNASIFTTGQSVTVYNNSASSQTITQGTSVTMYLVGTATTGNRTLAQRGLCTIFCVASNAFVITGGGLT